MPIIIRISVACVSLFTITFGRGHILVLLIVEATEFIKAFGVEEEALWIDKRFVLVVVKALVVVFAASWIPVCCSGSSFSRVSRRGVATFLVTFRCVPTIAAFSLTGIS